MPTAFLQTSTPPHRCTAPVARSTQVDILRHLWIGRCIAFRRPMDLLRAQDIQPPSLAAGFFASEQKENLLCPFYPSPRL